MAAVTAVRLPIIARRYHSTGSAGNLGHDSGLNRYHVSEVEAWIRERYTARGTQTRRSQRSTRTIGHRILMAHSLRSDVSPVGIEWVAGLTHPLALGDGGCFPRLLRPCFVPYPGPAQRPNPAWWVGLGAPEERATLCDMRTVTHREMRNQSGDILRHVADGETIQVTNNGRVAALIVPPGTDPLADLVSRGQVRVSRTPPASLRLIVRRKGTADSQAIIADVRGRW
jgi:prevent-host-death family protein